MAEITFLSCFLTVFFCFFLIVYGVISILFPRRVIDYEIRTAKKFYPKWLGAITVNHVSKRWYFYFAILCGIFSIFFGILGLYIIYLNLNN